jgi:hypothetical protein
MIADAAVVNNGQAKRRGIGGEKDQRGDRQSRKQMLEHGIVPLLACLLGYNAVQRAFASAADEIRCDAAIDR